MKEWANTVFHLKMIYYNMYILLNIKLIKLMMQL